MCASLRAGPKPDQIVAESEAIPVILIALLMGAQVAGGRAILD